MLHLNQIGTLAGLIQEKYPSVSYEKIRASLKNIDEPYYKYLLHLCYDKKNIQLDSELFRLGILN